jgi:hypothetical protein
MRPSGAKARILPGFWGAAEAPTNHLRTNSNLTFNLPSARVACGSRGGGTRHRRYGGTLVSRAKEKAAVGGGCFFTLRSCARLCDYAGADDLVFVLVDRLADAVLLAVDASLLGLREMTVVRRHIFLFAVLDARLTLFEVGGLLRAQLAALDAIGNAPLLVFFALVDLIHTRMARINDARSGARG